jgi:hypothetical protein
MTHKATLSAIITGPPPGFERPRPESGETLAHLVIRCFPEQWRGLLADMSRDLAVPHSTIEQLLAGKLDVEDLTVRSKVEDFINNRLPGHVRTIKSLAELHGELGQAIGGFDLPQILWPSERYAAGETAGQAYAKARGVEVLFSAAGWAEPFDLIPLLPFIKGQFAWLVPLGSRLEPFAVAMQLNRTLRMFASDPALSLYFDGLYSIIYRVSALTEVTGHPDHLPHDPDRITRLLEDAGYKVTGADPPVPFCHLEAMYGGKQQTTHRNGVSLPAARRWWQSLFDKARHNSEAGHQQERG